MNTSIKPFSLSLHDFICLSPEDTGNVDLLEFATPDAWDIVHKWQHTWAARDAVNESSLYLTMEERFMFICFVLLAEDSFPF